MYFKVTADWVSPPILFIYFSISSRTWSGSFLFLIFSSIYSISPALPPPPNPRLTMGFLVVAWDLIMSCRTFSSRSTTDLFFSVLWDKNVNNAYIFKSCLVICSSFNLSMADTSSSEQDLYIILFMLFSCYSCWFLSSASWYFSL